MVRIAIIPQAQSQSTIFIIGIVMAELVEAPSIDNLPFEIALLIRMPHVGHIVDGLKTWEMRSRSSKSGFTIGLIASKSGTIVGEAYFEKILEPLTDEEYDSHFDKHRVPNTSKELRDKYKYPWVLKNIKKYKNPIPYKHPAGAVIWVKMRESIFEI